MRAPRTTGGEDGSGLPPEISPAAPGRSARVADGFPLGEGLGGLARPEMTVRAPPSVVTKTHHEPSRHQKRCRTRTPSVSQPEHSPCPPRGQCQHSTHASIVKPGAARREESLTPNDTARHHASRGRKRRHPAGMLGFQDFTSREARHGREHERRRAPRERRKAATHGGRQYPPKSARDDGRSRPGPMGQQERRRPID